MINKVWNNLTYILFDRKMAAVFGKKLFSLLIIVLASTNVVAALQSPGLVSPNGAVAYTGSNPCFQWTQTSDATSYNVTVSLSTNFPAQRWQKRFNTGTSTCWAGGSGWEAKGTSPIPLPGSLSEGTNYYWRVVAENGSDQGFSTIWAFSVIKAPQTAPNITLGSTSTNGDYTVSWSTPVGSITNYQLTETTPSSTTYTTSSNSKSFVDRVGGSYSYQVKACNTVGCSPYSSQKSISVSPLPATSLVSPNDTEEVVYDSGQPCFQWAAVATDSYNLTVSLTPDFPTQRWQLNNLAGTSACWNDGAGGWEAKGTSPISIPSELAENTTYYWRVLTYRGGQIEYSATRTFTVAKPLSATSLIAPASAAVVNYIENQPCFEWTAVNTDYYNLTVSLTSDFPTQRWQLNNLSSTNACWDGGTADWEAKGTSSVAIPSELSENTTYYWRVLTFDGSQIAYSPTQTFTLSKPVAETVIYYHNDLLGSPVAATDENGDLLWREEYQPYGEKLVKSSASQPNNLWYTGKAHDDDIGLTYFGARYYDPLVGRFMGVDPVGFVEGNPMSFSRYAYANNNPYKYTDPDGEYIESAWDLFNIGIGVASFTANLGAGNLAGAALDAVGVIADTAALLTPVPGGAGAAIRAGRGVDKLADVTKSVGPKVGSAGGDGAKKAFSTKVKDQARQESNDTCVFCGTKTTREPGPTRSEIDHSIPKSRGGNNTIENAQNTCRTCNRSKGAKTTDEFLNQ